MFFMMTTALMDEHFGVYSAGSAARDFRLAEHGGRECPQSQSEKSSALAPVGQGLSWESDAD